MEKQQLGNQRRQREAAEIWTNRRPEIERLYVNGDWSLTQLAEHYVLSLRGVQNALKRLGIPTKSRGRAGISNGRFKDGMQSTIYRRMIKKIRCNRCGSMQQLLIHHMDGIHTNNTPSNLEVLCSPCHSSHHKQEWWDRRKSIA